MAAYQNDNAISKYPQYIESIYNRRHHAQINIEILREILLKNFGAISSTFALLQSQSSEQYPFISKEQAEEFIKNVCEL